MGSVHPAPAPALLHGPQENRRCFSSARSAAQGTGPPSRRAADRREGCRVSVVGESVRPLRDLPLRGVPGRQQQADVVTRVKQATWHFSGEGPRFETSGDFLGPFSSDRLNAVSCRVTVVPAPAGSVRGLLRMTPSEKALRVGDVTRGCLRAT